MTRFGISVAWLASIIAAILISICDATICCAKEPKPRANLTNRGNVVGAETPIISPHVPLDTIDADTRWAFRVVSPVTVASPIIRLGDVVRPLDPNMVAWQRLRRSPIGLLPLGSQPMTIQRHRLERAILDAEATPLAIDWLGPTEICVKLESNTQQKNHVRPAGATHPALKARLLADEGLASSPRIAPASHQRATGDADHAPLQVSVADARRIDHWITLAIARLHPAIDQEFRIAVPKNQPEFASLAPMSGVTSIEPIDPVKAGDCRFRLSARAVGGQIESQLTATLTPHPKVAFPRKSLRIGHRVTQHDLELRSIPEEDLHIDHVLDPAEVIGMEVQGNARAGRPLSRKDVGAATLIHRGDLIEVRVMGGGITVTTNAKAVGDGAESDLIEVETLTPRKRLLARVVQPGLVEIVTRAPKVSR